MIVRRALPVLLGLMASPVFARTRARISRFNVKANREENPMRTHSHFAGHLLVAVGCLVCIVTVITGCDLTGDPEAGRSVPTAWEADNDGLLRVSVVYEFENDRGLTVAHLTLDEDSVLQGIVGGFFASGLQPTDVGPVTDPSGGDLANE